MNPTGTWRHAEGGLERIAVDGGWIYRDPASGALCFVPAASAGAAARQRPQPVRQEEDRAA